MRPLATTLTLCLALPLAACATAPKTSSPPTTMAASAAAPMHMPAHQMPPRAIVLEDIERSRQNVLKYVDVAPETMLTYRPSPGVRTFAEQIEHAAGANSYILATVWKMQPAALTTDSAVYRRDKTALRAFVNRSFDAFAQTARDATDAQLTGEAAFMGNSKIGWRWIATCLEHTTWTLGQTVPYLRANNVTPPQYLPF